MNVSPNNTGTIIKISGPVLDARFPGAMPRLRELIVTDSGVHMEVASHVAPGVVRCVALESTDGLSCGESVRSTGGSISVPVGQAVLGRVVDVLGRPIDDKGPGVFQRQALHGGV